MHGGRAEKALSRIKTKNSKFCDLVKEFFINNATKVIIKQASVPETNYNCENLLKLVKKRNKSEN